MEYLLLAIKRIVYLRGIFTQLKVLKAPTNFEEELFGELKHQRRETYPALPCSDRELHSILDQWFDDGVIQPFNPQTLSTKEAKEDPHYCRLHQSVGHPTTACQALRRIFHVKINDRTLELPFKKRQKIE